MLLPQAALLAGKPTPLPPASGRAPAVGYGTVTEPGNATQALCDKTFLQRARSRKTTYRLKPSSLKQRKQAGSPASEIYPAAPAPALAPHRCHRPRAQTRPWALDSQFPRHRFPYTNLSLSSHPLQSRWLFYVPSDRREKAIDFLERRSGFGRQRPTHPPAPSQPPQPRPRFAHSSIGQPGVSRGALYSVGGFLYGLHLYH